MTVIDRPVRCMTKIRRSLWMIGSTGVLVTLVSLGSGLRNVSAHTDSSRWDCNNRTLKGTYAGWMEGTRPVPGGTGIETLRGVLTRTYDGKGNFTQVDNMKGSVTGIVPDRPGSGTYKVDADCSATTLFQPAPGITIEEKMIIVDYGNETHSITRTPAPLMVSASSKRIGFR